ncbi:MAG: hypothetical protein IJM01_07280 [Eubacterium sp.]|nr:hypothetical protein [Eubacterium sp.]
MNQTLSNGAVYKKVLGFSIRRLVFSIIFMAMIAGLSYGGFLLGKKLFHFTGAPLVGMGVGAVIAIVLVAIIAHFFMYVIKAGQIAVIMKAVTEDKIPDNPWQTGKTMVKERFGTVALYYAATSIIKGIFGEIGHAITKIGEAIGGDSGSAIGSAISIVINTIVNYLCDCCLGWVFYRKDQNAFKATCEGAVTFFKHGKTFLKNMGRVFGIGLASLIVIGGAFFGIFYLVALQFPHYIQVLAIEIRKLSEGSEPNKVISILSNETALTIAIAAVGALIIWSIIHSTFVKPFVLVGVLRNYMNTAIENIPAPSEFDILEKNSKKFRKYKNEHASDLQ